ncbi:glycosyltransferase family 4 protein [Aquabacterium sp.]|uniref:glycosyltransferase family 4 protein n=1 Tax=Aquabacterium sp. TaxID=1872578 RepID=UPI002C2E207A|nr:glycosyltransferase family 4 protein [Aquabacterium sp.]HSW06476.1 glycosyltransferase family 4 protein [Aquabacterium sp.]
MSPPRIAFVVPGDLDSLTGGYGYDRRIIGGLRAAGWTVDLVSLGGGFPWPDAATRQHAARLIAAIPEGCTVVADGLAFGALPELAVQHAARLRWVALVHHPLALECGLAAPQRQQLFDSERRALASAQAVIVTSAATARALADYGVAGHRIRVVMPGTAAAPLSTGSAAAAADGGLSLLCVATLIPRKGHAALIDALAGLQDRAWTLHCVGSTTRDAATAAAVRAGITHHGLGRRVRLHGEVDAPTLQAFYARADVFVLPSLHEGYGMALAEALAHGLPIVSSAAGAITDTVPANAGLLLPPGDGTALRAALARMLDEPALRQRLAAGARAARTQLPGWAQAIEHFAAALRAAALPPTLA